MRTYCIILFYMLLYKNEIKVKIKLERTQITSIHHKTSTKYKPLHVAEATTNILLHRLRIFEILPWDRNSYLTLVILPRLSRVDWSLVVWEVTHVVVK